MTAFRVWACGVLCVALAAPAFAAKRPHKAAILSTGVYLAAEFDAATTYHALHSCGNQCYEANPLVRPFARNPGIFVALGASAYAVNYLAGRLQSHGHAKWATALRLVTIGTHVGAGAYAVALTH